MRTLSVLSTEARGDIRLRCCLDVSRYFYGGKGTGLFLFVNAETLLEAPDILKAERVAGTGQARTLA